MQENTTYLKNYTPHPFHIDRVHLHVDIYADHALVNAVSHVKKQGEENFLELTGTQLELLAVEINGKAVHNYELDEKVLRIPTDLNEFTLTIKNKINPYQNFSAEGFYISGDILCTQCEAEGFRRITYYIDRPDNMATFTCTLSADKTKFPQLLANGDATDRGELENNRHFVTWVDPFPKPSYLFAMVAADLGVLKDQFTTRSGKNINLEIYVDHGRERQAQHAMDALKKSMLWDEKRFGLEYDLNTYMIVAAETFNAGAMENKGLNIFNAAYVLADQEIAEDHDFHFIERVIAHEYFHNWTGNRVTCRDWFQLTLKEGLTVFRDQEFTSDHHSRSVKRIDDASIIRDVQFKEDTSPMKHPIQPLSYQTIDNFYSPTVYNKGAEVIRMIHTIIGEEKFQKGMQAYFQENDGKAVTTEQFVAAMEKGSGENLTQFRHWYHQCGTPTVHVTPQWNADTQQYSLTMTQSLPEGNDRYNNDVVLDIPIKMAVFDREGKVQVPEQMLRLQENEQTFTFAQVTKQPVLSINRNFTAPIKIELEENITTRLSQLTHDDDPFCKFDAAQTVIPNRFCNIARQNRLITMSPKPFLLCYSKPKTFHYWQSYWLYRRSRH
ncbi:MAG: aminopeptidase N [Bdellovibrionota bacterium]